MAVLSQDQARFYLDLVLLITKVPSSLLPHPSLQDQLLLFSITKKITTILSLAHSKKPDAAAAAAKSLQSCSSLCDPIHGSPPGSSVPGILQARTLNWVAISFSNAWK